MATVGALAGVIVLRSRHEAAPRPGGDRPQAVAATVDETTAGAPATTAGRGDGAAFALLRGEPVGARRGIPLAATQAAKNKPSTTGRNRKSVGASASSGKPRGKKATSGRKSGQASRGASDDHPVYVPSVKGDRPVAAFLAALFAEAAAGGAHVLSSGDSYDDFASVACGPDGTVYVAYAAYFDGHDQIRLHRRLPAEAIAPARNRFGGAAWSTYTIVPLASPEPDIWMPQIAVDAKGRLWVIWSEQVGRSADKSGNWDLYARSLYQNTWGPLVRLTSDPMPDINHHVTVDADGRIHVVWQAHPKQNGDVQYAVFDGESWSDPLPVTDDEASDWFPRVAVDGNGTAWIAFDSYRNGDYDVFLTSVRDGRPGKIIPVATSSYYEAHASVACTPDGRVWVAWEQGGHNWGKDQGYWLRRQSRNMGTTLGSTRSVRVACWADDRLWAAPDVASCLPAGSRNRPSAMAGLNVGSDGRLWLRFRHMVQAKAKGRRASKAWREVVTHLTAQGWATANILPASQGRISVFSRTAAAGDGGLWIAYSSDARAPSNYHRPIQDSALVAHLPKPDVPPATPKLQPYQPPSPPAAIPAWNARREREQVAAIRAVREEIGGAPMRIVRGDLHRHTELSWDVGPGNDGSFLDFYRYMIDVAEMDFGALTDHQGGGHYKYWWWLTQKSADLFYLPPRFVPLYGYERSAKFPNGHRNIFHARRGVPVFPFQLRLGETGVFPGVGSDALVENDTKLLYEFLHRTGGIAISHTSATATMGTDWRDNDPVVEPVVEIYQGARNSYEALGAPRVHPENEPPDKAPGGFQKAGLLWNAYAKGYRLGITASSDHGSTHISYSLVYVPRNDRREIIEAIRQRHTYGATDNIILRVRAGDRFMGDEFAADEPPELTLDVIGTARVRSITLVRNNRYIYTTEPGKQHVRIRFTDMEPEQGVNYYYFRVEQTDGEIAWSSPVWIRYGQ
ncbi:MAG: exo-alpha-sialidase [Planctomycetota bacterium]|nr:MAG: exo-alpha-sialidase [Planctomycetota bacterium]